MEEWIGQNIANLSKGESRTTAISKIEHFVVIING